MFRNIPTVTRNILIANVIVFLLQILVGPANEEILKDFGAVSTIDSGEFRVWQLITSMFMHQNFMHIAFNMFAFVQFGAILEQVWGPKKFFQFYMICGIVGGIAFILLTSGYGSAIGASGAVMGVLVAFAMLFPNHELFMMFIPIPIKAKYLIPVVIAIDLFSEFSGAKTGIAHWAHLGGAAAGAALVYIYRRTGTRRY